MQETSPAYELLLAALRRLLVETDPLLGNRGIAAEALRMLEAPTDESPPLRLVAEKLQRLDLDIASPEERRALAVTHRALNVAALARDVMEPLRLIDVAKSPPTSISSLKAL
jgi:hypothetical protein